MDEQLKWKLQHCPVWFSICVEEIFKQLQIGIRRANMLHFNQTGHNPILVI